MKENSGRGWGMVIVIGSLHQMKECFAVQARSGGFPSPAHFSQLANSFRGPCVSPESGKHLFSLWCGHNGAACERLRDMNWAKQG